MTIWQRKTIPVSFQTPLLAPIIAHLQTHPHLHFSISLILMYFQNISNFWHIFHNLYFLLQLNLSDYEKEQSSNSPMIVKKYYHFQDLIMCLSLYTNGIVFNRIKKTHCKLALYFILLGEGSSGSSLKVQFKVGQGVVVETNNHYHSSVSLVQLI